MAAQASVKITKSMAYKGGTKVFSNRYHFNNGLPTTDARKESMADGIVAAEKLIYVADVTITSAVYYDAGSDLPVWSKTYSQAGTLVSSSFVPTPGNTAILLRYGTDQRTVKNHPIYLFNYYHGAGRQSGSGYDVPSTAQKAALQTYGDQWVSGFNDGSTVHHRAGPNGAVAQLALAETYLTHRDFRN